MKIVRQSVRIIELTEQEVGGMLKVNNPRFRLVDAKLVNESRQGVRLHLRFVESIGFAQVSTSVLSDPSFDVTRPQSAGAPPENTE